jgi:hypothetical protein
VQSSPFLTILKSFGIWGVAIVEHPKGVNRPVARAMAGAVPADVTG